MTDVVQCTAHFCYLLDKRDINPWNAGFKKPPTGAEPTKCALYLAPRSIEIKIERKLGGSGGWIIRKALLQVCLVWEGCVADDVGPEVRVADELGSIAAQVFAAVNKLQ